jgi:hypothetical protein
MWMSIQLKTKLNAVISGKSKLVMETLSRQLPISLEKAKKQAHSLKDQSVTKKSGRHWV